MTNRIAIGPPGSILDWDNWGKPVTDLLNEHDGRIETLERGALFARKTLDESISNNTLQDDDELFVTSAANASYNVSMHVIYQAAATPLIKFGFTVPSGATLQWTTGGLHFSVTASSAGIFDTISLNESQARELGAAGAGASVVARPSGTLVVGATGGSFKFRWSQLVTNATATIVKAGSSLVLTRIA